MSSNAPTDPAPSTPAHPAASHAPATVDLSVIIVSWNVWDLLRACLQSLHHLSYSLDGPPDVRGFGPATMRATLEVIVVDNASRDATADLLPARFPWVRLIRSADNLGFTKGNNLGYAASRGRFVYFLNPDTELPTDRRHADSLWTLYQAVASDASVGLAGPQLRFPDNSIQSSRRRFPTRWTGFWESTWLGRQWRGNPWAQRYYMADRSPDFRQDVDWVVGAAMLARRDVLEAIRDPSLLGPFDEGFFMYSEEVDLCRRIKATGLRIAYVPEALVIHYEGRSSGQVVAARYIYFNRSKLRDAAKTFGPGWAGFLRQFLLWEFRLQWLIEAAKWLVGHRRSLRRQRMAAYAQVLADGLSIPELRTN